MAERKHQRNSATQIDAASLLLELEDSGKSLKLLRDELLRHIDRFGKQLPARLLATILSYAGAQEVGRSQTVCSSWRLPAGLVDRLWRGCYEQDWESETREAKEIAVAGPGTAWIERYRRRKQTEANWLAGRYRETKHTLPHAARSLAVSGSQLFVGCSNGLLMQLDAAASGSIVKSLNTGLGVIYALAVHGNLVFAGGFPSDDVVKCWQLPGLTLYREFKNANTRFGCLATNGELLIAASATQNGLSAWKVKTGELVFSTQLQREPWCLAVDWEAQVAYAGEWDGYVESVRIPTGEVLRSVRLDNCSFPRAMALDAQARQLILAPGTASVCVLQLPKLGELCRTQGGTWGMALRSSDRKRRGLVVGAEHTCAVLSTHTLERIADLDISVPRTSNYMVATATRLFVAVLDQDGNNCLVVADFTPPV